MTTVKIAKTITHQAPISDELGVGYSVYQGYDPTTEDYPYHVELKWVKEFKLPQGFRVAKGNDDKLHIFGDSIYPAILSVNTYGDSDKHPFVLYDVSTDEYHRLDQTVDSRLDLLRQVGELLHGDKWQRKIAQDLNINDRTVRHWIAQEREIPNGIVNDLKTILQNHLNKTKSFLDNNF